MLIAAARRRVAALRQPRSTLRIARVLWIAWAVILWNVVFDHVIVVAGRSYIAAAGQAARDLSISAPARMDEWMRPAVTNGVWIATASAAGVLVLGLSLIRYVAPPYQLDRSDR